MANNRLSNLFRSMAGAFRVPSRQNIELEYLNRSISIHDLERRQNEVNAGKFHSF